MIRPDVIKVPSPDNKDKKILGVRVTIALRIRKRKNKRGSCKSS